VTRPVGGIVFGHFGATIGRKELLVMTLFIMGVATIPLESGGGRPWWVASYVCAVGVMSAVNTSLMRRTF
jgi:hypothetical protein